MLAAPTADSRRRSSPELKVPGLELRRVFDKVRDDVLEPTYIPQLLCIYRMRCKANGVHGESSYPTTSRDQLADGALLFNSLNC